MVGLPRFRPSPQSTHSCRAEQRTEDTVTEHTPQTTSNFTPCFRYRLTSPVFAAHTVGALHIRPALLPAAGPSMCVTLSERRVHVIAPHSIRHGTSRPGSGSSLSPPAHHDSPLPRSSHIIIKHTLCHWSYRPCACQIWEAIGRRPEETSPSAPRDSGRRPSHPRLPRRQVAKAGGAAPAATPALSP